MREIRFRARFKNIRNSIICWQFLGINETIPAGSAFIRVSDWVQYTGLKDKNCVEIYEGDIVYIPAGFYTDDQLHASPEIKQIIQFEIDQNDSDNGYYLFAPQDITWNDIEVIGNIYENPELLSEAK